jgi:diacylglycerol kinase family enzyme
MRALRAKILINAAAREGFDETRQRRLTEMFTTAGATAEIEIAATPTEVGNMASAAAKQDYDLVVAGGGDGTVSLVASSLVGTGKRFGVLPLGTLNHFAKDLQIPLDFDQAVKNLLTGSPVEVDVAEVNERFFVNNSSLGLYPTIVHEREKQQRLGSGKWPAFIWAAITALRRYPFVDVRVTVKDKILTRRTPFVFVANNDYLMKSFNIGRRERLNAGELSLYMTKQMSRLGLVRLALRALFGRVREDKDFLAMRAQAVTIRTKAKQLRVAMDGEVEVLVTPLEYKIRPGALSVIVPAAKRNED